MCVSAHSQLQTNSGDYPKVEWLAVDASLQNSHPPKLRTVRATILLLSRVS